MTTTTLGHPTVARVQTTRSFPWRTVATWTLTALLGLLFIASGAGKLVGPSQIVESFARWGYSDAFRLVIGMAEVMGGLLLFHKRFTAAVSVDLAVIMAGAVFTHLKTPGEMQAALFPLVLFVLLGVLAWIRWDALGITREPWNAGRQER